MAGYGIEKIVAKDINKFIKIKAFMDTKDQHFLEVHVYSKVMSETDDFKAVMKHLDSTHLYFAAAKACKSDNILFELKYVCYPQSGGAPPVSSPQARVPIVWAFTFQGNNEWAKLRQENKDNWPELRGFVEEQAEWYIEDIMNMKEFQGIKGLYHLEAGKSKFTGW